jgi:hypothetical protein
MAGCRRFLGSAFDPKQTLPTESELPYLLVVLPREILQFRIL